MVNGLSRPSAAAITSKTLMPEFAATLFADPRLVVLCGGVGAARFLAGLARVAQPERITAVVNVGDDETVYGLHVSPDIDTLLYGLAGMFDDERGYGIRGDTFDWLDRLEQLGEPPWFRIGDTDLTTHIFRSMKLQQGARMSEITAAMAKAFGVAMHVLPATDERLRTRLTTDQGELAFQTYFVRHRWQPAVRSIRFEGAEQARPAPGVVDAIDEADAVIIAPSNPLISINPILAVAGIRDAVRKRRGSTIAITPIVAGEAIKGPAAAMMRSLGLRTDAVGVAALYRDVASAFVLDEADASLAGDVKREGMRAVVAPTIMRDDTSRRKLAQIVLEASRQG